MEVYLEISVQMLPKGGGEHWVIGEHLYGDSISKHAVWLDDDVDYFLDFLLEHKAEAGNNTNFKLATYRQAAELMQGHSSQGKTKDAESCKNKYCAVRYTVEFTFIFY